jgi:CheY-like chemotaxis protein
VNAVKRILVVEDERIVALDLRTALEDLGYLVVGTVSSSDEALRIADQEPLDLVLMDIRIRGSQDGIATAGELRERHRVPVVFLTANADATTIERAQRIQPAAYLIKPYSTVALREAIGAALDRPEHDPGS